VTLLSVLQEMQGLQVIDFKRNQNKFDRFMSAQPYVASKLISLPRYGKHTHMCIEHCKKITTNGSHAHDDICDTLSDAIQAALADKIVTPMHSATNKQAEKRKAELLMHNFQEIQNLRQNRLGW
jgi:hypothetical protein